MFSDVRGNVKGVININKKNKYRVTSIRLMRFLYGLGFDKESDYTNSQETWLFERSDELNKSLAFFFNMRKELRNKNIK